MASWFLRLLWAEGKITVEGNVDKVMLLAELMKQA